MNTEQLVLDAVERGKALGYAEGMKAMRHKELTDEEIVNLINKHIDYVPDEDSGMKVIGVMDFARAILKKAQDD